MSCAISWVRAGSKGFPMISVELSFFPLLYSKLFASWFQLVNLDILKSSVCHIELYRRSLEALTKFFNYKRVLETVSMSPYVTSSKHELHQQRLGRARGLRFWIFLPDLKIIREYSSRKTLNTMNTWDLVRLQYSVSKRHGKVLKLPAVGIVSTGEQSCSHGSALWASGEDSPCCNWNPYMHKIRINYYEN